jgi:hypothetical protein
MNGNLLGERIALNFVNPRSSQVPNILKVPLSKCLLSDQQWAGYLVLFICNLDMAGDGSSSNFIGQWLRKMDGLEEALNTSSFGLS